jgi:aldehyde:ferredoxin oxidoreductase
MAPDTLKPILGKTAFIDLTTGVVRVEDTPLELVRALLGGRGANMAYLHSLLPDGIDPLSPENVLIFGTGLLTGYPVPNSSRMNISAKSPESGNLGDANMGGFFPHAMKKAGFDRLVVTGRSATPVLLHMCDGEVTIADATPYWGLDVQKSQEAIAGDLGETTRSAVIGVAGENLVRFAAVMNAKKNAAARGGMGAVMGSKNLKAISATGGKLPHAAERKELLAYRKELTKYLHDSKVVQILGKVGTPLLYNPANTLGALRTKNSQENSWTPDLGAHELEKHVDQMVSCAGCAVHCRHVNRFGGEGPEYSTVGLLGANCGIDKIEDVLKLNNLCNDLGLDTSSTGTVIPWAMELYQRGIIGDDKTGTPLEWGDFERVYTLIEEIATRRGFGDTLAESSQAVALGKLPEEAAGYLIAIKGLPQSDPHDPRYIKSFALGLAVASRGADHLRNRPTLDILKLPDDVREAIYGAPTVADPTSYDTKEIIVAFSENIYAVSDCLGICRFVTRGFNSPKLLGFEHFSKLIKLALGLDFSEEELTDAGRRVVDLERLVNRKLGLTRADDTLPRRYFDEPMPGGSTKGHRIERDKFDEMLTRYYSLRGWSEEGAPSAEKTGALAKITEAAKPSG